MPNSVFGTLKGNDPKTDPCINFWCEITQWCNADGRGRPESSQSPASSHFLGLRQEEVDSLAKKISSEGVMVGVCWLCPHSHRANHVSWDKWESQPASRGLQHHQQLGSEDGHLALIGKAHNPITRLQLETGGRSPLLCHCKEGESSSFTTYFHLPFREDKQGSRKAVWKRQHQRIYIPIAHWTMPIRIFFSQTIGLNLKYRLKVIPPLQ